MDTGAVTEHVREDKNEPTGKEVMSCRNFLNYGDIPLHQSQKEFNSCDLEGGKFK
jgi:hypothetical protein